MSRPNRIFYLHFGIFLTALSFLAIYLFKFSGLFFDQSLNLCEKFVLSIFSSTHLFFGLVFLLILFWGLWAVVFNYFKTRAFLNRLLQNKIESPKIKAIAKKFGLEDRVTVIHSENYYSFCYDFFKPTICISSVFVKNLTPKQLEAVLAHEKYHLQNRDPLKIFLGQISSTMFPFIPILKDLNNHYALSKEVAADAMAVSETSMQDICGALVKMLNNQNNAVCGVAFFGVREGFEKRVQILTEQKVFNGRTVSLQNLIISFLVFISFFAILAIPAQAQVTGGNSLQCNFVPANFSTPQSGKIPASFPYSK